MELNTNTYIDIGLAVVILQLATAFKIRCPDVSERHLRSKAWCPNAYKYTCLYDENQHSYNESCSVKFDFQRPGYRVTLRTNLNAAACLDDLYQPFIFFTNKSSNCQLEKSLCTEEGQIVSLNGTILTDRQCRCNYAHGYTYVTKPNNVCSCVPSVEDCSCFRKRCSNTSHILSPDYLCIDKVKWSGKFRCSSIKELRIPTMTMSGNRKNMKELLFISVRQKQASVKIVILLTVVVMLLTFSISFILIEYKCSGNIMESQGYDTSPLHKQTKGKESKHETKTQDNSNEEIPEILKAEEKVVIVSQSVDTSLTNEQNEIEENKQEPKTQDNSNEEFKEILEADEKVVIVSQSVDTSLINERNEIEESKQEFKTKNNFDEEFKEIVEADEKVAIVSQGVDTSLINEQNEIEESKQEPKTQDNSNKEFKEILEADEKEKNEAKCGNTFQLYERDERHHAKHEHKTQEKLDEQKQKILNIEGLERMDNDIEPILETDIITKVLEKIVSNNCVLLLEEPDCRKSTLLHKIASCSEDHLGYKFVPCIELSDIFDNQDESAQSAFVIDDIYGRFVFSFEKFMEWKSQEKRIKQLLDDGKVKLLIICSSATFLTETVLTLSLIKDYAVILPIRHMSPNTEEEYQLTDQINEVNKIRDSNPPAFYSLFFCILRKGYFCEDLLTAERGSVFTTFRDNVLDSLKIEIQPEDFLKDLPFPMNNFIKKENGSFSIQQTSIFNALATYFGQELQKLFIRYADPEIVIHHCCLVTGPDFEVNGMFCIQVNEENEEIYFERIKNQLQHGNISEVLSVRQMELESYQTKFLGFLENLSKDALKQICIIKCRFESKTMLELFSDKKCMKLVKFLREQL